MSKRGFKSSVPKPAIKQASAAKPENLAMPPFWKLLVRSLDLFRRNAATVLFLFMLPLLLQLLGRSLAGDLTRLDAELIQGIAIQFWAVVLLLVNIGVSQLFSLRAVRGERPGIFGTYKAGMYYILRVAGLTAVVALFMLASLLAFVIPSLIVLRRYALSAFFLIEDNTGIRQAMMRSAEACKPLAVRLNLWAMLIFYVVLGIAAWFLTDWFDVYGQTAAYLLIAATIFVPALLYQAVIDRQAATSPKEQ